MIIIYYNVHYTCTFSRTINILFSNIGKISHTYRELLIHDFLVFHLLSIISCRRKGCNNFWGNVANGKTSLMRWTDCSALFLVCNYKYQYTFSNSIYRHKGPMLSEYHQAWTMSITALAHFSGVGFGKFSFWAFKMRKSTLLLGKYSF